MTIKELKDKLSKYDDNLEIELYDPESFRYYPIHGVNDEFVDDTLQDKRIVVLS
jgi:hypothetical protein